MQSLLLAFGVVFLAELGDKSQLLAFAFATRIGVRWVLLGLVVSNLLTQGLSALTGGLIGALVDGPLLGLVGGALFLLFAVLSLRGDPDAETEATESDVRRHGWRGAVAVAVGVSVAELGDKTMLATMTLAAHESVLPVWIGATLGMTATGVLGVAAGKVIGDRVGERTVRVASAVMFAAAGVWLLVEAL